MLGFKSLPVLIVAASTMLMTLRVTDAQPIGVSCEIYRIEQTSGVLPGISAFFDHQERTRPRRTSLNRVAVRRCVNPTGPTTYIFIGPVGKDAGVCHYLESDISDLFSDDGKFVPSSTGFIDALLYPGEYMLATNGTCPRQDDSPYVHTRGVSPSQFRTLLAAYKQTLSSPNAFDTALVEVKPNDRRSDWRADFKQWFRQRFGTSPNLAFVMQEPAGTYQLMMDAGWQFDFQFTQGGLRVVGLSFAVH